LESALNLLGLHYSHFRPVSRDRYEQNQALVQRARPKNGLQRGRMREDGLELSLIVKTWQRNAGDALNLPSRSTHGRVIGPEAQADIRIE
jgi:hypothetical protein